MQLTNISKSKIIGLGEMSILPGQTIDIPKEFEKNSAIEIYKSVGIAIVSGTPTKDDDKDDAKDKDSTVKKEDKEALRKKRLASLNGISDEDLAKLAEELEIKSSDCVDTADMLKKVRTALYKS